MNGFAERGLDEDAFGEKKGAFSGIRSFDAFREYLFPKPIIDVSNYHCESLQKAIQMSPLSQS